MNKRLLCMLLGLPLIGINTAQADESIVTPDTRKAIAETTGSKKVKWSPKVNMTDVLGSEPKSKPASKDEEQEIFFAADEVENNQEQSLITASGNVEIIRGNLTLHADKVVYNQKEDTVTAVGNVVLVEKDGSVVFADYSELNNHMTQGEMKNIKVIMADQSRMAASSFERKEQDKKVLRNAVYTPCDVCRNSDPLWQIKATKVVHDAENKDVNYQNAFVEIKGTPVFYTPFLSHPDPTVKRRSGFLFPRIMSNSYLGGAVQGQYFWSIDDQQDVLFNPIVTTDKGIVYSGAFNKYVYNGNMSVSGSFLKDEDSDKNRGNIFAYGRYEINDYWVADTDINYASDNNYLKDLNLPKRDDTWLTSRARLQGFDNRNYAALEAYYYKILSYDLRYANRPMVLPLFNYENYGAPDRYGAYTKTNLSFASVTHEEDNSSQRATMINSWNLPYTSPYGEKYKLVASLKSDFYYIDNYVYEDDEPFTGTAARIFPQVGLEWRLPFIRATEDSRQIIEPIIVAALAPNQSNKPEKIPNEDSQDVELNDTNILNLDRYSGYDRNDTGSRVSYGFNWSSYGNRFGRTSVLLAQSYEFSKDESFAAADDQKGSFTDYVGRIYASPNEYFDLNYRFKLNKDDYSVTYSELSSGMGPRILRLYLSYIYFQANETSSVKNEERKELYTGVRSQLTKNWSVSVYNRQDLAKNGGTLEYGGFLTYEDECTRLVFNIEKDNSNDPDYEGDFEFGFTFFLKTLGGTGTK